MPRGPATRVGRELTGGEVLPSGDGARVAHAPGHTPGSIALHLPRHGTPLTGDAAAMTEAAANGW